jgi:hypothetical protein
MPGSMVGDPTRYHIGPLLLVEIKKAKASCQIYDFAEVLDQTDQQACYAFATYPVVNSLGLIIALGNCWTYREYNWINLRWRLLFGDGIPKGRI